MRLASPARVNKLNIDVIEVHIPGETVKKRLDSASYINNIPSFVDLSPTSCEHSSSQDFSRYEVRPENVVLI